MSSDLKHQATCSTEQKAQILADAARILGSQVKIEPIGDGRFRVYWSKDVKLKKG